ncbi:MAG: PAS domain-containing protein [Bacteroidota bacterium]
MSLSENRNLNELSGLVADQVTAMLAYWDKNQVCGFANSAYREWFGKTPEQMIGKITMKELLGPLYEKNLPYIIGVLKGKKQVFEREIPLPKGGARHSIATYYPDILNGEVIGFFVHVADVTPIKLLEAKLINLEKTRNREVLRSIIETREKEREIIAVELRDSISQTLAYCKMMLQNANKKEPDNTILNEITKYIHQAIHELNVLSSNLSTSLIKDFGLKSAVEDIIINIQNKYNCIISFECENEIIEQLTLHDRISLFRIIQDYLLMVAANPGSGRISVIVHFAPPELSLELSHNDLQFEVPADSREYSDIQNRIEYYEGSMNEKKEGQRKILIISVNMTGS